MQNSTLLLTALFVAALVTYLLVRPTPKSTPPIGRVGSTSASPKTRGPSSTPPDLVHSDSPTATSDRPSPTLTRTPAPTTHRSAASSVSVSRSASLPASSRAAASRAGSSTPTPP
jgi:hypothetical protein